MTERKRRKPVNYVNNKDFCNALIQYKIECAAAKDAGLPKPQIPNYIGACFLKIATNYVNKARWNRYTWKDDMIGDAYLQCCTYIHNFNPDITRNPFAYFTQYCHNAFRQRTETENENTYIRYRIMLDTPASDMIATEDTDTEHHMENADYSYEVMDDFVRNFESYRDVKKPRKKRNTTKRADVLFDDDDGEDDGDPVVDNNVNKERKSNGKSTS